MKQLLLAATLILTAASAQAADWSVGSITVSDPFARATAGKAKAGGGFLMITNKGEADRLVAAHADVSATTELHTHIHEGNVMKMRQVEAIDVPANGEVALQPGGFHVMFMGLNGPLKKGETFPLELTFEKAGKVTVDVSIASIGAKTAPDMDHSKMDHSEMDHSTMDKADMKHDDMQQGDMEKHDHGKMDHSKN
ncbi:copper chaperone PCu(A)C [Cohaesibacter sp. CAU 1516]|uniref:copper chaperone PCu(A)C n=1 Tax=Cohaesibacter sp. CAU 1516 TaxID=2576038 RepID=UPI0010FEFBA8|nr:copper chaperone PCu(A)C [Cohaesibacter sp. CAU 1516]TLP44781.1 copper chaperone PCu(A)C [Cohaesibacter sp. CAU 1516]